MEAYSYPEYYDIAFGVDDAGREVDFFAAAIGRFSRVPVRRVLEIACGTAPYLAEWRRRGYRYCGIDLSPAMLDAARVKADRLGVDADFVAADMRDFAATAIGRVDLAYALLGSVYVGSNRELPRGADRPRRADLQRVRHPRCRRPWCDPHDRQPGADQGLLAAGIPLSH